MAEALGDETGVQGVEGHGGQAMGGKGVGGGGPDGVDRAWMGTDRLAFGVSMLWPPLSEDNFGLKPAISLPVQMDDGKSSDVTSCADG